MGSLVRRQCCDHRMGNRLGDRLEDRHGGEDLLDHHVDRGSGCGGVDRVDLRDGVVEDRVGGCHLLGCSLEVLVELESEMADPSEVVVEEGALQLVVGEGLEDHGVHDRDDGHGEAWAH